MSPVLLARTRVNQSITERVSANPNAVVDWRQELKLSSSVLSRAVKDEGFEVIVKGMPMMMAKRSLDWGTRFILMDKVRNFIQTPGEPLTDLQKLSASFLGGAMSVSMTVPVDRMMPIIQQAGKEKTSIVKTMSHKLKQEGPTTLFRGWGMRTIHTGWHTAFAIFVADKIYGMF